MAATSSLSLPTLLLPPPKRSQSFTLLSAALRRRPYLVVSRRQLSPARPLRPYAAPDSPAIEFHELVERDWSFLDPTSADLEQKLARVAAAGAAGEGARVLVALGGEQFVNRLVEVMAGCSLMLVVHYSLLVLALIKERHDDVRCWQGELVELPKKWAQIDVVFLPHLPALKSSLRQIFSLLAGRCVSGARVVISEVGGREGVKKQKTENPDVVTSDLPIRIDLEKVAADHSLQICEFVDEPSFYLAVLKFS